MSTQARSWLELKNKLHLELVRVVDWRRAATLDPRALRLELRLVVERLLDRLNPLVNRLERERTIEEVLADAVGFGLLEAYFGDDRVQEIWVEGPDKIRVRCGDAILSAQFSFQSRDQLYLITERLLKASGQTLDPAPGSVVEREETPPNFILTARFPTSRQESPTLHFRRLRPAVVPAVAPALVPPRLPPHELRLFVRFVKACFNAGIDDLIAADEATLRPLAEQAVNDFLVSAEHSVPAEERERLVTLMLLEARRSDVG